jgi:predicted Zn-dependent peptidase
MKFHQKVLPSGLKIITVPMEATEAVTLLVLVSTGSKYEQKKINGISHFLEHLFFKGTKRRPEVGQIHRALDQLGAEHNAFTSKEFTGYWVKAAAKHFDAALDIVSDILLDPLFKPEEIEKERGVIIQEISMYEDMPQHKVIEVFEDLLYGDQPAGWDVAGTKKIVANISRKEIMDYRNRQYVASNTLVVAAGKINPEKSQEKIINFFSRFQHGRAESKKEVKEKQIKPAARFFYKETDQTHLVLGLRAYDMYDEKRYALGLLGIILGGNTSSRLFMEIREKLGLAYYVRAEVQHYTDSGYLAVSAGIPHEDLEKASRKIVEVLRRIREKGVSDIEVKLAKDYLRGTLALSFEASDEIASFFGERALFYKKIQTPGELFKNIEKTGKNDIIKAAREIIHPAKINLAVIGPHRNAAGCQKILADI